MPKNSKMSLDDLSHSDKILVSFYRASNGTTVRLPFETIVLRAWQDFPADFSLPNYPEYPDSYVISKRIYSNLITNRLVVSLKNKSYRLSNKGLVEARKILGLAKETARNEEDSPIQLNRDEEAFFLNALRSRTFSAWKGEGGKGLIDYDVRVFFQFSTGTPVKERKRKAETAREALEKAIALNLPEAEELNRLRDFLFRRFPELFQEKL